MRVIGVVGELENNDGIAVSDSYYIWTHKKFDIGYNGKQIVDVNLTSENKVKLVQGARIPFSYEVNWKRSNVKFEDRFDKYLDPNFFQHRVSLHLLQTSMPRLHNVQNFYRNESYTNMQINCSFRYTGSASSIVL